MGVSCREMVETSNMHFKRDAYPMLSVISYGVDDNNNPKKVYNHLLSEIRVAKDVQFSLAGIKCALETARATVGPKKCLWVQSDGAESQFWSKEMFHCLPRFMNNLPAHDYDSIVWFKTVSGHGKGEIDSSHGCVKQDIVRQYNHLGGCGFDGERLENIGVVDSASQLVNFLQNERKDHFGTLEHKKEDSLGYTLVGRYVSEYVVDPNFDKQSEKISGSRSYHLVKLIKDENNQWEERKLLFKKGRLPITVQEF
ncbi:Oidioi.mRNA.OKI2018_I69.chr1.g923.t1.cds [Oikopleura dioica]|uniref:Oidioi.mRNA.OKI2018_I69.chr1.g923.t1.cds n=1 Tax=Oikopleura dioica TaxID=34765 RepID=A0ABN7SVL7_OIKDI|nr:Oidioi.mRNA.OKI2018_I69.chr1.g923.t1.cds [Oikopleura dioica]